jgi:hypothetical protein
VMISQVHRSAAAGSRDLAAVQPRTCLNSRKVCSRLLTQSAQPSQDFGGQVREQERQPRDVVAGVKDDQDGRIPSRQCPAVISRATTSRTWAAVTAIWSSSDSDRWQERLQDRQDLASLLQVTSGIKDVITSAVLVAGPLLSSAFSLFLPS